MANIGVLTIFEGVLLPNNEPVADYLEDLSEKNIGRLGRMSWKHEEIAIRRYIQMHGEYMEGKRTPANMSATKFASKSFVQEFALHFAEIDFDTYTESTKSMPVTSAEAILHFLFVFYMSHYEGELSQNKKIKLVSFATWFDRKRKKAASALRAKLRRREQNYQELTGRRRESYDALLKQGKRTWKQNWQDHGYATRMVDFRSAKHVILMGDFEDIDWWRAFKIPKARVDAATDGSDIRREVLKKYRIWSRFMHTDNVNNRAVGGPFADRLAKRLLSLMDKTASMEAWYSGLDVVVIE